MLSLNVKTDDVTKGRKDLDPRGRLRAVAGSSGANGLKYQLNNIIIPTLEVLETHAGFFSVAS